MKNSIVTAFFILISPLGLHAGGINVVHLGPSDVLKFEVSSGEAALDFTLAHGDNTGPFMLPDKPATIKSPMENVPSLDLPASDKPRIAILTPSDEGFKWHTVVAKPTDEKWAFRVVNLSAFPANVLCGKELLEIPIGGESAVAVTKKSEVRIKIPNTVDLSYKGNEPRGIVAFVYREGDKWNAILLPDR